MILSRQHFDIADRAVIEKLVVQTPMRYCGLFQNEACFLHFKSGSMLLSSAAGKTTITASESVLLNCGNYFADLVQQKANATMEIVAVHLYPDLLKEIYKNEIPPSFKHRTGVPVSYSVQNTSVISHFIDSLAVYFDNPALVSTDLITLKLKELILLLLQTDQASSVADLFARFFSTREVIIRDTVQAHLFSNLSVTEIATLSGLSRSSFKREFQKLFNDTPANYIKTKRIEEAQKLLRVTSLSVSEICYQVGFNDVSHFTKVFKVHVGSSPVAYRSETVRQVEPN